MGSPGQEPFERVEATGSTVIQLAKAAGAHVIGMAGGAAKAAQVRSLGADVAIDYRAEADIAGAVAAAARSFRPQGGINVFFDNVGGDLLDAMLPLMAMRGRVAVCGMMAQYNDADHPAGIRNLWQLVVNRVRMEGFITYDFPECLAEAQAVLGRLFDEGRLNPLENLNYGFESLTRAFIALMEGRTTGKTLVLV